MDTSPEYIYELIEKLSWHVCWQGRDHRELRLDVANVLRSLLQERDEYKRRAEAAETDILDMLIEEGGNLVLSHWCAGNCPDNDYSKCEQKIRWRGLCKENGGVLD